MKKLTKIELEFLDHSNRIEGVRDAKSLNDAKTAWNYLKGVKSLSIPVILKAHKLLMKRQPLSDHQKGAFRTCRVWVGGREGLEWPLIPEVMLNWANERAVNGTGIMNRHVEFEHIHPFADGNGRLGRMLYNWERKKKRMFIHVIHEGMEQYLYYKWF